MPTAAWDPLAPVHGQPAGSRPDGRRLRIGILSLTSAEFDSRSQRIARSAAEAGHQVTLYARWEPGLKREESLDGYRIVRLPASLDFLLPWGRRRRIAKHQGFGKSARSRQPSAAAAASGEPAATTTPAAKRGAPTRSRPTGPGLLRRVLAVAARPFRRVWRRTIPDLVKNYRHFPLIPMAWGIALEDAVEPADIWHGMWASSLPSLQRLRARHGGKTIYDCRDILLRSRAFERMPASRRRILQRIERRWARACDAIITVNDPYADIEQGILGTERPTVVMSCPERWEPPEIRPDLIRASLGIPTSKNVVLYQGAIKSDRGLDESLEAILLVPNACLVLLGYGPLYKRYRALAATDPYREKLYVIDAVPPSRLLDWSASADVMVMAIPDSSLNHRYTTPQKLFEAMAVGVPVVASDLPGMAPIVRASGSGELCDPTSPASIAAALRRILDAPAEARAEYSHRALEAAASTYNWQRQLRVLGSVYGELLARIDS